MADPRASIPGSLPLLSLGQVSKSFPGVKALVDVSFAVNRGEVHALMGENGAGKSTLLKILSGIYHPDSGTLALDGQSRQFANPADAIASGIAYVPQETTVQPYMTVAENILLARQPKRRLGLIDGRAATSRAANILRELRADISPSVPAGTLSAAQKQLVAIARALAMEAKLIIFDEATSSLTTTEAEHLFSVIRDLKQQQMGIVFVTHRMEELAICDRVTVLRDGRLIATRPITAITVDEVIEMMVGRELAHTSSAQTDVPVGKEVLRVQGLSVPGMLRDINFALHAGEILGIAGLVGSGRTELARTLFGDLKPEAGNITLSGARLVARSPHDAIDAGIGLVPEDRKQEALILAQPIRQNISLAVLRSVARLGFLRPSRECQLAREYCSALNVRAPSIETDVGNLSGGNQQRVVIAKWLASSPTVLIVDEPTRGIDVAAKQEVHAHLAELAARGIAVIMISSEMQELIATCRRLLVMYRGTVSGVLTADDITQENIMRLALGPANEPAA